jgi:hypothetical protein
MKVYDILTPSNYSQKSCVVANSMAMAENLFLAEYPGTTILEIKLHAEYVIIQKEVPHAQ